MCFVVVLLFKQSDGILVNEFRVGVACAWLCDGFLLVLQFIGDPLYDGEHVGKVFCDLGVNFSADLRDFFE